MQMNYNPYQQQQQTMNYNPVFTNYPQIAQNIPQRIQPEPQIMGKIVQNAEMITANDVPLNGSVAFFPKQDLSEIYAKSWTADGVIRTMTFKPIQNEEVSNLSTESTESQIGAILNVTDGLEKTLNEIVSKIDNLEKNLSKTATKTRSSSAKKEDE